MTIIIAVIFYLIFMNLNSIKMFPINIKQAFNSLLSRDFIFGH